MEVSLLVFLSVFVAIVACCVPLFVLSYDFPQTRKATGSPIIVLLCSFLLLYLIMFKVHFIFIFTGCLFYLYAPPVPLSFFSFFYLSLSLSSVVHCVADALLLDFSLLFPRLFFFCVFCSPFSYLVLFLCLFNGSAMRCPPRRSHFTLFQTRCR
jgi:hypothetical protein